MHPAGPPPFPKPRNNLCGARTRKGTPCRAPAVTGRPRCRMHGGAKGSGAPIGNRNALKHGRYTAAAIAWRRHLAALVRECRESISMFGANPDSATRKW